MATLFYMTLLAFLVVFKLFSIAHSCACLFVLLACNFRVYHVLSLRHLAQGLEQLTKYLLND